MEIIVLLKSLNYFHGKNPIMYVCLKDSITFDLTEKANNNLESPKIFAHIYLNKFAFIN